MSDPTHKEDTMTYTNILTFTLGAIFGLVLVTGLSIWPPMPTEAEAFCAVQFGPDGIARFNACLERERYQENMLQEERRQSDALEQLKREC